MPTQPAGLAEIEGHLQALLGLLDRNIRALSPASIERATLECIQFDRIAPALKDLQELLATLAKEETATTNLLFRPGFKRPW